MNINAFAQAISALSRYYEDCNLWAKKYFGRDNAIKHVVDHKYEQLLRLHKIVVAFEECGYNPLWFDIANEIDTLRKRDPDLTGVTITVDFNSIGGRHAFIHRQLYVDSAR